MTGDSLQENLSQTEEKAMATDLLSGQISFTGLGSGTDFETLVSQLIEIESTHMNKLESWKLSWELKIQALEELQNSIVSLNTTLQQFDTINEFLAKDTSSSNQSVLTAKADSTAEATTHSIEVNQLARNSIWVCGSGVGGTDSEVISSDATFTYSYHDPDKANPTTISLDLQGGDSLEDLMNRINTDPDNPGVRASIISDGTNYYLQLRGLDLGADAELIISNASFGNLGGFVETQTNQNAQLKVNGWPPGADEWIESDTNMVSKAVEGVSINLKNVGYSQLTVDTNIDLIMENVHTIVDKINEVRSLFTEATAVNESKYQQSSSDTTLYKTNTTYKNSVQVDSDNKGSIMTGNYAVQMVDSNIKSILAGPAAGFEYYDSINQTGDIFTSFAQLGITTDVQEGSQTQGLLVIDDVVLRDALTINPDAVGQLFSAEDIGDQSVTSGSFKFYSSVQGITKPGIYDVSYTVNGGVITNATIGGYGATVDNGNLTAVDGPAKGIVIKVLDTGTDGTFGGDVRIKQGKTRELINTLKDYTSKQTGPLKIVSDNYEDIIDNIDDKIFYEKERLTLREQNLRLKFARLEALLGEYDKISSSLGSAINQLDS